jgi:hypothetical protein
MMSMILIKKPNLNSIRGKKQISLKDRRLFVILLKTKG